MIKIAFCDDDSRILSQLQGLLARFGEGCGFPLEQRAYRSPGELLEDLRSGLRWDILLLDILMPGGSGMELARSIRDWDQQVKIVFLTNSPEFAVASYEVGAYYYLLKPVTEESLFPVLRRAAEECRKPQEKNLILRSKAGIVAVDPHKVEYCEVIGHDLEFHLQDGRMLACKGRLNDLEESLRSMGRFLRPHRSYLVNMAFISHISYKAVLMTSGAEIPIPHGKFNDCKAAYLAYAFEKERVLL